MHREGSWLVFRIPFGCCIRLCWSLDDIPANYLTTISSIHDGTSFLTYDAPAVAVLLPRSLDAFVAETAVESTRDQR